MSEWKTHLDRDFEEESKNKNSFSLTLNSEYGGWNTDSGYEGYGLPLDLAKWICDTLNTHGKDCPYKMNSYGYWIKKDAE